MKKKGFVSTSLIYTFFIIFLLLMLFLLNSYSRVRFLLEDYKYDIKESFASLNEADINVYIMVWNHITEEYELADEVPSFGYVYESEFSYCKNGSTLTYSSGNISVTASRKDSCYVYFREIERDIVLRVYKKESASGNKVLVKNIPSRAYNLESATCTKGTIEFNETTRKFKISSSEKTVCEAVFTRKDMDIIVNVYKEASSGTHVYKIDGVDRKFTLVGDIPGSNYTLHSYVCDNGNATITESSGELLVDATGKDVCNVYYVGGSDKVEIIIMQESETGVSGFTTGKKYTRVYQHPGSGYSYIGFKCDDTNATVTYSNGIFTGENDTQTTCYVYFNQYNSGTAIINYYLETTNGDYESVSSIPELGYIFNSEKSSCKNGSSYKVNNNYVEVNATSEDEVCNFYYDQATADIKVLVYVMNRETQKYELGSVPVVGYEMYNAGCTNGGEIKYQNSSLIVSNDGPTICTVYFR